MRALVTGSSGFLGRHLVCALRRRGDFVVCLVRDEVGGKYWDLFSATLGGERLSAAYAVVRGSFDQVERAISEYEIDTVFHLAAQTQVSTAVANPVGTFEANICGTWRVLEACRRQKVQKVIVSSSDKVYGDGSSPYREDQPIEATGIYATSKTCADLLAQSYAREFRMPIAITRCGNLYGPGHTNWSTLIPGTIRSLLRGERPRLRSDGGPKRDFLFVEDAVDGYLRLADSQCTGAFNFGTGCGSSVMDVVAAIQEIMGTALEPIIDKPQAAAIEIRAQVLNCKKAAEELEWSPRHTLTKGLAKTIPWYQQNSKVMSL